MAEGIEITVPFPSVDIELRKGGDDYGFGWVNVASVPLPGDVIHHEAARWVVTRREFDSQRTTDGIANVYVVVERAA